MWMRDAFARPRSEWASVHMHIYEKKKRGLCAASPASSFSKYAQCNTSHRAKRKGVR